MIPFERLVSHLESHSRWLLQVHYSVEAQGKMERICVYFKQGAAVKKQHRYPLNLSSNLLRFHSTFARFKQRLNKMRYTPLNRRSLRDSGRVAADVFIKSAVDGQAPSPVTASLAAVIPNKFQLQCWIVWAVFMVFVSPYPYFPKAASRTQMLSI